MEKNQIVLHKVWNIRIQISYFRERFLVVLLYFYLIILLILIFLISFMKFGEWWYPTCFVWSSAYKPKLLHCSWTYHGTSVRHFFIFLLCCINSLNNEMLLFLGHDRVFHKLTLRNSKSKSNSNCWRVRQLKLAWNWLIFLDFWYLFITFIMSGFEEKNIYDRIKSCDFHYFLCEFSLIYIFLVLWQSKDKDGTDGSTSTHVIERTAPGISNKYSVWGGLLVCMSLLGSFQYSKCPYFCWLYLPFPPILLLQLC